MIHKIYSGGKTNEISFPLGGIGTGSVGLGGNGRLLDWEIFNRPDKGSINGFTHIAVKAERNGALIDARILNGDLYKDLSGQPGRNFGTGLNKMTMAGFPHFRSCDFYGEYPIAELHFGDDVFPAKVKLTAFNPFIPLNEKDSSIPAAFFEITLENTSGEETDFSVAFTLENPWRSSKNTYVSIDGKSYMRALQPDCPADGFGYGDMTLATDSDGEISYQEAWYRGKWWDQVETYWRNFTECERFKNRCYPDTAAFDRGTLCVRKRVPAGSRVSVRFVMSWNCPNRQNYWDKYTVTENGIETEKPMRNYYSYLFGDSFASASYSLDNWDRLSSETRRWHDELFSSTLPSEVLDAVSATSSVLKTETCVRIGENGDFFGWEGLNANSGSCEGSCTHVWNYAYTMPFLFPTLERNLRTNDYLYNQHDNGSMEFRARIPFGRGFRGMRACADGQFGGVMKVYRDWKISGDTDWLASIWNFVKKSIEFAWNDTNSDRWDADKDGVLEGRQHHTLDMELFGPSSWLEGFYLGALKAGAEMAHAMNDTEAEKEYSGLFTKGKEKTEKLLFNGRYYQQKINLSDKAMLESFGEDAVSSYWNDEAGQIKYQIGEGCAVDQVLAQWHADISGLGEIFDPDNLSEALKSMIKYNIKPDMRDHYNTFRIFAVNDESGTVICDYPDGSVKPAIPVPYAQECMHGFEYAFAGLLISRGFIDEGLRVVRSVRDRYDGENRNPWNEIECGSNYARSMASYALIPILSGFKFDLVKGIIGFEPKYSKSDFRCVWSVGTAWGNIISDCSLYTEINIISGALGIKEIILPRMNSVSSVIIDDKEAGFSLNGKSVLLSTAHQITDKVIIKA